MGIMLPKDIENQVPDQLLLTFSGWKMLFRQTKFKEYEQNIVFANFRFVNNNPLQYLITIIFIVSFQVWLS